MCAVLSNPASAARNEPLVNFGTVTLVAPPGVTLTDARVREAIAASALGRAWVISDEKPGAMRLTYAPSGGKHQVTVDVTYTASGFEVNFLNSVNLNQEVRDGTTLIHPNYNRWINNLNHDVRARVNRIPPPLQAAPAAAPASASS